MITGTRVARAPGLGGPADRRRRCTILDADGDELPAGEVGEVCMRSGAGRHDPTYRYIGAEARTRDGGWESLGDIGWIDEDGYLYLARPPQPT